jgi:Polyketide cyclase / dehydrase and lipid transport
MMQSEKITEGPIGVGTRFRAMARSGRRVGEMLIEVTECDRARRFGSRTVMPSVDVNGGLTFEPIDGATRISWSWEVSPRAPLRLLGPGRPPWAPATNGLDRAQDPAGRMRPCRRRNRAVIKTDLRRGWRGWRPGQSPGLRIIMVRSRRLEAGVGAARPIRIKRSG